SAGASQAGDRARARFPAEPVRSARTGSAPARMHESPGSLDRAARFSGAPDAGAGAMSLSTPFIERPIATTLLTLAVALSGILAYQFLPVSPLPQVEFPTIQVSAGLPGASPETMASALATPLERQFGRIAGVTEMT